MSCGVATVDLPLGPQLIEALVGSDSVKAQSASSGAGHRPLDRNEPSKRAIQSRMWESWSALDHAWYALFEGLSSSAGRSGPRACALGYGWSALCRGRKRPAISRFSGLTDDLTAASQRWVPSVAHDTTEPVLVQRAAPPSCRPWAGQGWHARDSRYSNTRRYDARNHI